MEQILAEVRRLIATRGLEHDASGHAADGKALWVYLARQHERHLAGPCVQRPLLVIYETGSSRMLCQLAGSAVFGGTER